MTKKQNSNQRCAVVFQILRQKVWRWRGEVEFCHLAFGITKTRACHLLAWEGVGRESL